MNKQGNSNKKVWFILGVAFLLVFAMVFFFGLSRHKRTIVRVEKDGQLVLEDGTTVYLAGIKNKAFGEEGYESAMFLLSQMLSNKEVWISKEGSLGYKVWIGCVESLPGISSCRNGLLINDELVKVGVAAPAL